MFNIFNLTSVSYIENYFTGERENKFNDVFQEYLGCGTKIKAALKIKPVSKPKWFVPFDMI